MSVKSKIQALITAANAKTGKSDTDLTAAVQSLIDGYGAAVEQISFTIDDGSEVNTFSAVSGATWTEWIGGYSRVISETSGLTLYCYNNGHVFADEAGVNALSLDGSTAGSGGDEIVSGATYTIISWGG